MPEQDIAYQLARIANCLATIQVAAVIWIASAVFKVIGKLLAPAPTKRTHGKDLRVE